MFSVSGVSSGRRDGGWPIGDPAATANSILDLEDVMEGLVGVVPRLLSARHVAEQTGLSLYRVYELARLGILPHKRLGRSVVFTADAVAGFLNGSDQNSSSGSTPTSTR